MSRFIVPERVIQQADRCVHKNSCVENGTCGDRPLCRVESALSHQISFLKTEKLEVCNYRLNFGGRELCMCPVRTFIFEHYGE